MSSPIMIRRQEVPLRVESGIVLQTRRDPNEMGRQELTSGGVRPNPENSKDVSDTQRIQGEFRTTLVKEARLLIYGNDAQPTLG